MIALTVSLFSAITKYCNISNYLVQDAHHWRSESWFTIVPMSAMQGVKCSPVHMHRMYEYALVHSCVCTTLCYEPPSSLYFYTVMLPKGVVCMTDVCLLQVG